MSGRKITADECLAIGLRREWAKGIDSAISQGTTGAGRFAGVAAGTGDDRET